MLCDRLSPVVDGAEETEVTCSGGRRRALWIEMLY
jgi:hypothetical protein